MMMDDASSSTRRASGEIHRRAIYHFTMKLSRGIGSNLAGGQPQSSDT